MKGLEVERSLRCLGILNPGAVSWFLVTQSCRGWGYAKRGGVLSEFVSQTVREP